ncbi:Polyamine oxidase [Seminavis robusta]|uniref:Amine oxidase n=1 Tax=Seminavis robusta TaxID=568900 RepID=A0A9N8EPQ6_9STRA|nr:Polyamine oxidase [Seminavis robusta]|eukprot:Sro1390_g268660.1 Polyamine oxidase (570) ;mRNA; r:17406-19295
MWKSIVLCIALLCLCEGSASTTGESEGSSSNIRRGRGPHRKLGLLESAWQRIQNILAEPRVTVTQEFYDVVIVGAGMAGLAAAAELKAIDPDISYIILESSNRIGGRVRSTTFGAAGKQFVVEDGANWLYEDSSYPTWQLANDLGLQSFKNDYRDFTMYDTTGTQVADATAQARLDVFLDAFREAEKDADNEFEDTGDSGFVDKGVVGLLNQNGWNVASDSSGNMDYIFQWLFVDFEYAESDTSQRFFPYESGDPYLVTDQRGFEHLVQTYQANNVPSDRIRLNTKVQAINYDVNFCGGPGPLYKAIVNTDFVEYYAQRVINTVSVGVHNSNGIIYRPSLAYPPETTNPYKMAQYIKVFYQFSTKFWDSKQFVYVMRDVSQRGQCHHWQDMDVEIPGSGIIRCELMTEAFEALIDSTTLELSAATLDSLLDPLRSAYGTSTVGTPIATYYPKLNLDRDFGYGAYGNWQVGRTFSEFARFFGGVDEFSSRCDHNGCNSLGEWIVQFSGSASCYEHSEFVHGAFFAGQRSARFAMDSLGKDVDTGKSECDVSFSEFGFTPFMGVGANRSNV